MQTNLIQVFEHHTLFYGKDYGGVAFTKKHFDLLAKLNMLHDNKYFTLVHKGIKFSQYVGVVQIDTLTIEILPKADQSSNNPLVWRNVLIEMLRVTRKIKVNQVGQADVNKQNIHLLDIYFDWFLREMEILIHKGLIKKYYKEIKNINALKGKLEFAGHLTKNLIHKERFYTSHQIYDTDHQIHQILNLALVIIEQLTKGNYLYHKCKRVQLNFPEVSSISCTESTFNKLRINRKSEPYVKAWEISRLIILNYAPNISSGSERMLALLFDMNNLWEEYIIMQLRFACLGKDHRVEGQKSKVFWGSMSLRPDIILTLNSGDQIVLDTKWKRLEANKPSTHDLRQMYVYNDHWHSKFSILLYPGANTKFFYKKFEYPEHYCGVLKMNVLNESGLLDFEIGNKILECLESSAVL